MGECLAQYYGPDTQHPVRKNLEFFIPLRNKIEHRSLPEIDASIFGECQAMLLNFDAMLEKEFGAQWCLRESLTFALQIFPSARNLSEAVRLNPDAQTVAEFVEQYRSSLSVDVLQSGQYAFKAFLIQVANHKGKDTLPIQFVHYDRLPEEDKKNVDRFVAMVKFKEVPVANANTIPARQVAKRVQHALGNPKITRGNKDVDKYSLDWHTRCWRKYGVRPPVKSQKPEQTKTQYCIYDRRHNDYGYTEEWVAFLIDKFRDGKEYDAMYGLSSERSGA